MEVADKDRPKTAFCTTEGLSESKVMLFGLCNTPATFQRLMDLVLAGLQWSHCLVYIDGVVILGRSFEEHLQHLQQVFDTLQQAELKLKPRKYRFLQRKVDYLGHVVSNKGIAPDPAKIEKIASWPTPSIPKEVQQFLGLAGYYRRFIQDFAEVVRLLHHFTERNRPFKWSTEHLTAFDKLRDCLCSSPILCYPDFSRPFLLDTDASDSGIGAVLSQLDDKAGGSVWLPMLAGC